MKLNIGCGRDYRNGWINCDASRAVKADQYFDLTTGLPFDDHAADEIYISGVLEQIGPNKDFLFVMNELHRVLKASGTMSLVVPDASFPIAFRDPFDCRTFTGETWRYFAAGDRYYQLYGSVYGFHPWRVVSSHTTEQGIMHVTLAPETPAV